MLFTLFPRIKQLCQGWMQSTPLLTQKEKISPFLESMKCENINAKSRALDCNLVWHVVPYFNVNWVSNFVEYILEVWNLTKPFLKMEYVFFINDTSHDINS